MSTSTATGLPRYVRAAHIDGWSPGPSPSYQVAYPSLRPCGPRSRRSSSAGTASGDIRSESGGVPYRS